MNLNEIMQQAQKLQQGLVQAQQELAQTVVEHAVAGGKVTVAMNGHQELLKVEIHPDVITPDDPEMLQDLIFTAFSGCLKKSREAAEVKMKSATGGMGMPNLDQLMRG